MKWSGVVEQQGEGRDSHTHLLWRIMAACVFYALASTLFLALLRILPAKSARLHRTPAGSLVTGGCWLSVAVAQEGRVANLVLGVDSNRHVAVPFTVHLFVYAGEPDACRINEVRSYRRI